MVDWELFVSIGCWVALEGHRDPLIPVMRKEVKAVEKVTASTYNSQTGLKKDIPWQYQGQVGGQDLVIL